MQIAALDGAHPFGVAGDQLPLDITGLDGRNHAAVLLHPRHFLFGALDQGLHLGVDHRRAVEDIAVFQQIGLEGQHLLHPQRPLLVPGTRQTQRLVPGRQLNRPGAGVLGQRHGQHFQHDALDIVLRLRLGQPQRVDLHAVAEAAHLLILHAVAFPGDLVPQLHERPHLAAFLDEADAGVDEEGDAAHHLLEVFRIDLAGVLHRVQHRHRGGQGIGQFLHRGGARFLQVIAADVGRIPLGNVLDRVADDIGDQPHRRPRRDRYRCRATGIP